MEKFRQMAGWVVKTVEIRDVFVFGGLAITVHGVAALSEPAAWIVSGVVLFILGARR